MGNGELASELGKGFPGSLDGAPFLLPLGETVLRHELDRWFSTCAIRPLIVGEFEDSALLKVFGQKGAGLFAVPSVIEDQVRIQYGVEPIGRAEGLVERFYAISVERKVRHPAVEAICNRAREDLFS
jgi:LysR family transcriptional activator of nhaA